MRDLNVWVGTGRLTRDAEIKYTNSGICVTKFSIACNGEKKDGQNWISDPSFFDCVLWGKLGEAVSPRLTKGRQVSISGELKQNRWTAQNGENHSKIEIVVQGIIIPFDAGDRGDKNSKPPLDGEPARAQGQATQTISADEFYDDIPF